MSFEQEKLAPIAYVFGVVALLFVAGWYVVNRQLGLPGQIGLVLAVVGFAAGVLLDPDRTRQALTGRQARYGSNALLLVLSFAGILGVINYLALENPTTWDLTEDQRYSLAPETENLLDSLEQPVTIKGFYTADAAGSRENVEPLLNQYVEASEGLVELEFIDPRQQPLQAEQYGVTRDGTLVVLQGERSELVSTATERDISSSIIRVSQPGERVLYFITGHGERELTSSSDPGYAQARAALESKNYRVEELNLLSVNEIPEDAEVVVIAGSDQAISEEELETLSVYLNQGGALMILLEPVVETEIEAGENPLYPYLEEEWGLLVHNDVVVDLDSNLPLAGIAVSYANHPITDRMGNLASFYPSARSLASVEGGIEGVNTTELVQTGQNSWGETNFQSLSGEGELGFQEGEDFAGPVTVAMAAAEDESGSRLVVFGDSDFASNANYFGLGNGDIFVNSVDWLAGQENLIQLTPRERTQRTVVPPSVQTLGLIFLATVILIPGASIGAGVVVWWQRRRRMK
ncbi:MAG: GldG family protein [Anaerolineales bacterium]